MDAGNKLKVFLFFIADVVALYAALFIALLIRYGGNFYPQLLNAQVSAFTVIFILWIIIFYIAGLYDLRRLRNNIDFIKTLFLCIGVNAALAVLLFYLIPAFGIAPKTTLLIFIVVFAIIEIFWRRFLNRLMTFGEAPNKVLMIGGGTIGKEIKYAIAENPQLGYAIKAEMDEKTAYADSKKIKDAALREGVNLIVISGKLKHEPTLVTVLYELFASGIIVTDLTSFYELIMRKVPLPEIQETWFLENIAREVNFYDPLKRAGEFIFALALGIVLIPFEIIIAFLIALTSRGPVIYKQVRVGERGKNFKLYKFRTMRLDAEKDGAQWASKNDARTTPIGGALRASHLDELPQLWNIVRGDLSFVGPRPERPEFVAKLEARIPYYGARLFIKPGVTGWAQINHRADLTDDDVKEKLQYDIYYLKNRSPILDWAIILKTIKSIFVSPK
ncbi:MAG: sugar transferase [Minisyncoccia bacterium]|jgi:exopolysaccharide biosynthesis polyprenyl glycosylphosphotransferase